MNSGFFSLVFTLYLSRTQSPFFTFWHDVFHSTVTCILLQKIHYILRTVEFEIKTNTHTGSLSFSCSLSHSNISNRMSSKGYLNTVDDGWLAHSGLVHQNEKCGADAIMYAYLLCTSPSFVFPVCMQMSICLHGYFLCKNNFASDNEMKRLFHILHENTHSHFNIWILI